MQPKDYQKELIKRCNEARCAAQELGLLSTPKKNRFIEAMATALREKRSDILMANSIDVSKAELQEADPRNIERIRLDARELEAITKTLVTLSGLADPVGRIDSTWLRPNGLKIEKTRIPLGVVAVVHTAHPGVTVKAIGMCLKAGNAVFLRGGADCFETSRILGEILLEAGVEAGLPKGAIQFVPWPEREALKELISLENRLDLIISQGGPRLDQALLDHARAPVVRQGAGICHIYVHDDATQDTALAVITDAKCTFPHACSAIETLLLHADIAEEFAPLLAAQMEKNDVTIYGDERFCVLVPQTTPASSLDWETEHMALTLNVRIVDNLQEAIDHIQRFSTKLSEAILTNDRKVAETFTNSIDSACVFVNASTTFTDGAEFGMGIDLGVGTGRLHARGPMGLDELTTYKYVVTGKGQTRNQH